MRLNTLQRYLVLRWRDSCIKLKVGVIPEIRRLQEQLNMQASFRRRVVISSFNMKALSDHEYLSRFRFKRRDVGFISEIIGWDATGHENGRTRTTKKRCHTDPEEATANFLRILGSPSHWVDLQLEFGKQIAALTEILYHTLKLFPFTLGTNFKPVPTYWWLLEQRITHNVCLREDLYCRMLWDSLTVQPSISRDQVALVIELHTADTSVETLSNFRQYPLLMALFFIILVPWKKTQYDTLSSVSD
jgi:hypothetical protein